ncbi:MAG: type II toxin-antitoxin system VapC family toxin [Candidatus Bathyarchaeia archaeon]|jgi:predicted nucleic acid-binding protein
MRFVDANVFLYQIIKSPQKDYEISGKILERIQSGEEAATALPVIQEVVKWLEYNHRKGEIASFLLVVNSYFSMSKLTVFWENFIPAVEDMNKKQISFIDSIILQVMKQNKISEIYSNDKDFDRVDWVKRIWE